MVVIAYILLQWLRDNIYSTILNIIYEIQFQYWLILSTTDSLSSLFGSASFLIWSSSNWNCLSSSSFIFMVSISADLNLEAFDSDSLESRHFPTFFPLTCLINLPRPLPFMGAELTDITSVLSAIESEDTNPDVSHPLLVAFLGSGVGWISTTGWISGTGWTSPALSFSSFRALTLSNSLWILENSDLPSILGQDSIVYTTT